MALVENPKDYEDRKTTNLRLSPWVKEKLREEAEEKDTTMADIINLVLEERYKKGE